MRGCSMLQEHLGEGGDGAANGRSGMTGAMASTGKSATWPASAEGDETSREASDRSCPPFSGRTCAARYSAGVHSTGPAELARSAVPERAVAGRCVEAHADV